MKLRKYILINYIIMATVLILTVKHIKGLTEVPLQLAVNEQLSREQFHHKEDSHTAAYADSLEKDQTVEKVLKRQRRYLEFPEGTSFQLVYDLIVGVVDYTNYLILGVTVALAWELPSKPPSEILQDLTERLKDGTLGTSRNDTLENIRYIDKKPQSNVKKKYERIYQHSVQPVFRPPMHYSYYYPNTETDSYYRPSKFKTDITNKQNSWPKNSNYYYRPRQLYPFTKWPKNPVQQYSLPGIKYPWWNMQQRFNNTFRQHQSSIRRFDQNTVQSRRKSSKGTLYGTYKTPSETGRAEHRIYPVFGKRSFFNKQKLNETQTLPQYRFKRSGITTDEPSKWDRIHIEHHRKTRHDLYQRIETYLIGRGAHGHHCVLRALCETGQKSHEHRPGSFVGEIMRAIFTMPEPLDATTVGGQQIGHREKRYDIANTLEGDCANRYYLCKDSLWSSHFVL